VAVPTVTYTGATATGTGNVTATVSGGGAACGFSAAQFVAVATPLAGYTFPHGLFNSTLAGCTVGSTVTFNITYPSPLPAGAQYWKYGRVAGNPAAHWYSIPATLAGRYTATFSITDGGLGDDDLTANGSIDDPGGPGFATAVVVVTEPVSITYNLHYSKIGHGSLMGSLNQVVEQGTNAGTVTAVPESGYHFVRWSDGVTTASRTDRNINNNLYVSAIFELDVVAQAQKIPAQERTALIALYNSTHGADWKDKTGWLGAEGTECRWFGVSCYNNHVSTLSLYANQLSGIIPVELGQLSKLLNLNLGVNQLNGTIPASLGQLSDLQSLSLNNNQLSGTIPVAPASIFVNRSSLCPNQLAPSVDAAWDAATGTTPWSRDCTSATPTAISTQDYIIGLYITYFNRAPDKAGLAYWEQAAALQGATQTFNAISNGFYQNGVAKTNYPASMSDAAFITRMYAYALSRTKPDANGQAYWEGLLKAGLTRIQLMVEFIGTVLRYDVTLDTTSSPVEKTAALNAQRMIRNKIAAGVFFATDALGPGDKSNVPLDALGNTDITSAAYVASIEVLKDVNENTATIQVSYEKCKQYKITLPN
jgi:Leucine-rich repeat (LRR) protein